MAISNESAVEKPAEKPEAGAAEIAKKETDATPEKPPTEKAAKKPEPKVKSAHHPYGRDRVAERESEQQVRDKRHFA